MNLIPTRWIETETSIRIELTTFEKGNRTFAVRTPGGECLNKNGEWEHEPLPSNRDEQFLERCRFDSYTQAAGYLAMVMY